MAESMGSGQPCLFAKQTSHGTQAFESPALRQILSYPLLAISYQLQIFDSLHFGQVAELDRRRAVTPLSGLQT